MTTAPDESTTPCGANVDCRLLKVTAPIVGGLRGLLERAIKNPFDVCPFIAVSRVANDREPAVRMERPRRATVARLIHAIKGAGLLHAGEVTLGDAAAVARLTTRAILAAPHWWCGPAPDPGRRL